MLPWASQATGTTLKPPIAALAGFVPWAEVGMRQTLRCSSPRDACQARMTSMPVYSPWDPAFGCNEIAAKPVISASQVSRSLKSFW